MRTQPNHRPRSTRPLSTCLFLGLLLAAAVPVEAQGVQPDSSVPGFSLTDMHGRAKNFPSLTGRVTVVIFFSTRCPMSNAFNSRRNDLFHEFRKQVRFVVIDSEANESLEEERTYAKDVGFAFPVFRDSENKAADRLGARVTTDTFVLDAEGVVRYHGYIEDAPNPTRTTNQGLRRALTAVLAGQPVPMARTRAVGCAIRRAHP